jgi:hypothetical protein
LNATPFAILLCSTKARGNATEHLRQQKIAYNKKGALLSSEDESAPCVSKNPGAKMQIHLFGNPAILFDRTRGFASPDYSDFARSENVFSIVAFRLSYGSKD